MNKESFLSGYCFEKQGYNFEEGLLKSLLMFSPVIAGAPIGGLIGRMAAKDTKESKRAGTTYGVTKGMKTGLGAMSGAALGALSTLLMNKELGEDSLKYTIPAGALLGSILGYKYMPYPLITGDRSFEEHLYRKAYGENK